MKRVLAFLLLISLGVAGFWLWKRRTAPPAAQARPRIHWEKVEEGKPNQMGGQFLLAGTGNDECHCLMAVFTAPDGDEHALTEESVQQVDPVMEGGRPVIRLYDRNLVRFEDRGQAGWHYSIEVVLDVNGTEIREVMEKGLILNESSFFSDDFGTDPLNVKLVDLIKARVPGARFNLAPRVYRFHESGRILCIVPYRLLSDSGPGKA